MNIAISEKNMVYRTGFYYFEFKIKDAGSYSNYLAGVCFKSIDDQFRETYDSIIYSENDIVKFLGRHKHQIGVYLDGYIYNEACVGCNIFQHNLIP